MMLDRPSYTNEHVCVTFRDADVSSIGRPEIISPTPSEGLLKRGVYKVGSDISLQAFKELIAREYDPDSYLTSVLYYQTVGYKGLWIYKEGSSFLPFCADPTVPDRFIIFPARGKANIHLLRNLLARLPPAKFGYSLVRVRNSLNLGQTLKQARIPLKSVQHKTHQNIDTVFRLFNVDKLERSPISKEETSYTFMAIAPKHKAGLSLWLNRSETDICLLPYFNATIIEGLVARRTGIACYKNAKLFGFAVWDYSNSIFIEYLETRLSTVMAQKVFLTLRIGMKYCRKRGWVRTMPTEDFTIENRDRESSGKIEIPQKEDIKALLKAADEDITGIDGAIVRVLCHCGLRPSEMRGLRRDGIHSDASPANLKIVQRADIYNKIGKPKSRAGYRTIPMGPETLRAIKKSMLSRKAGDYSLVFPCTEGNVIKYDYFVHHWWPKLMLRAGLAKTKTVTYKSAPDKKVKIIVSKFHPYALRHVAASRWIEMGLMPKRIQELMGHSSLKMTMDIYGHLWVNPAADKEIAAVTEQAFA